MIATRAMVIAARRAEYDYYQRRGALGERFIPTPDVVIRVMIQAALDLIDPPAAPVEPGPAASIPVVVVARPPRRRRQ